MWEQVCRVGLLMGHRIVSTWAEGRQQAAPRGLHPTHGFALPPASSLPGCRLGAAAVSWRQHGRVRLGLQHGGAGWTERPREQMRVKRVQQQFSIASNLASARNGAGQKSTRGDARGTCHRYTHARFQEIENSAPQDKVEELVASAGGACKVCGRVCARRG